MSAPGARQLVLDLPHPAALGRADFVVGAANRAALALLDAWPAWPAPVVLLSGPEGSGKTHLAEIWRAEANAARVSAAELPAADIDRLASAGALVVEDIHRAAGMEVALFHLLNRTKALGTSVLLTSRVPVPGLPLTLPDLVSRLRAATPAELAPPDDELLRLVLGKLFADRQIAVDAATLDYLLPRMERSFASASALVAELDRAGLASSRPVGRSLASDLLRERQGDFFGPEDEG